MATFRRFSELSLRYTVIFLSWISSNYLCMLRMSSSLGTPGECLHKFVFRTLHFVVRPEKPASEELCYRLISHIDPLSFALASFAKTSCVAPHVCVLRTQLPTPSLNYSVDDSSLRRRRVFHLFVLPGSIGHAHFTLYYCTVLYCTR